MKKFLFVLSIILINFISLQAQTTGSFEETMTFNSSDHTLAYYVPISYNSEQSYPLVVALHGCGGNAVSFRNNLIAISDSLNAIILCPDFNGNQMSGTNGQIIPDAISNTIENLNYNVNTEAVYLTGFSCNGQETFKQGWNDIYPFAGLIPFNAWLPSLSSDYNFDSNIHTCICTGTQDPSFDNNLIIYDSLMVHGGSGKLNVMPGIAHQWNFPTRDIELLECINWIDSLNQFTTSISETISGDLDLKIYPNPTNEFFNISNLNGETLLISFYSNTGELISETKSNQINSVISTLDIASGLYHVVVTNEKGMIRREKILVVR